MKLYFFGLLILYVFSVLNRAMSLALGTPPQIMVSYVADILLFSLCLRVCYGMAFNKRYFTPQSVKLIYYGVMGMVVVSLFLLTKGELLGLPDLEIHVLNLLLWLLPYLLFALPCILLGRVLKDDGDDCR